MKFLLEKEITFIIASYVRSINNYIRGKNISMKYVKISKISKEILNMYSQSF